MSHTNHTLLTLDGVTAGYDGRAVIHDVSLDVHRGECLGVIGPNGGGKTTLVKVILGLLKPMHGSVTFYRDEQPISHLAMGYLPQYSSIDRRFPISVNEVVASGLVDVKPLFGGYTVQQREQIAHTISRLGLEGLECRPISDLSGGQLQRVLLARAVVSRPELLILDEPNTYIDRRFQEQMYQMLAEIGRACTLIVVTHDVASLIPLAQRFACVNGTVHCHDTADVPVTHMEQHLTEMML